MKGIKLIYIITTGAKSEKIDRWREKEKEKNKEERSYERNKEVNL